MIKKVFGLGLILIMLIAVLAGCTDYGYQFHFSVVGDKGEITIEDEAFLRKVQLCSESPMCELECPENSQLIQRLGGQNGIYQLTFIATPEEGYRVKEWIFNGEIVEGNKTNSYTAKISSEQNYNGIIMVVFEQILNN